MPDTGLTSDYLHALHEEEKNITVKLVNGHAKTLEEYREIIGIVKGLRSAGHILQTTIKQYNKLQDFGDDDD